SPLQALEPSPGLAMIAGRTERIKFGMSVAVLPVRDPLVLAKEIATIDFLSNGRMLPAFGLGVDNDAEWLAVGRTPRHRGAMTDEAVPLMRRIWSEDAVTHTGQFYNTHELTIYPKPKQQPLPGCGLVDAPRRLTNVWRVWETVSSAPTSPQRKPARPCAPFARLLRSTNGLCQRTITELLSPFTLATRISVRRSPRW